MKLKSLVAAALLVTSMSTFAVDITVSPLVTVVELVRSAVGTVVSPFATSAASTLEMSGVQKEQLQAVRSDAVDYLAGSEASNILKASISEIKSRSESLNGYSDAQIAGLIVTALE